ncbi:MAG: pyridoxal 5'-phosphate synthase lyase subunit PdxS [Bdellovibrionota bacterium]
MAIKSKAKKSPKSLKKPAQKAAQAQLLVPSFELKVGLAEMLRGGVIMDVVTPEQAKIAEASGAVAVMALERVPSDIRREGGVARMSPPELVEKIMKTVSIPVMAKCRIGHFAEAQVLEAIGVDFIDESEVLTPADEEFHIAKSSFRVPFVCGCKNLGEALRRIGEGAALIRTKGEPGTGNVVEAVRHLRQINQDIKRIMFLDEAELMTEAKNMGAPYELLLKVRKFGKLPVPNFAAGGVATPADAALCMQLGAETVFVGSGIFKSDSPEKFARAIVRAVAGFDRPTEVLAASKGLASAMRGLEIKTIPEAEKMSERGW